MDQSCLYLHYRTHSQPNWSSPSFIYSLASELTFPIGSVWVSRLWTKALSVLVFYITLLRLAFVSLHKYLLVIYPSILIIINKERGIRFCFLLNKGERQAMKTRSWIFVWRVVKEVLCCHNPLIPFLLRLLNCHTQLVSSRRQYFTKGVYCAWFFISICLS